MNRTLWTLSIALVVLALCAPAAGQRNSLLGRGNGSAGQAPPAAQPAVREPAVVLPGMPPAPRPRQPATRSEPPLNTVLLYASPFAVEAPQPQEIRVHDLVTIVIRENKTATSDAKLKSEKEWKVEAELAKWFRLDPKHRLIPQNFPRGTPGVDFEFGNEYEGKGKVDRKDTLTTRITAEVIDVKPNGNLVLEAKKNIRMDDEGYIITLTGMCRSRDVTLDNTILSTQIADPVIDVQHTGAVRDAARRGWLMRLFDLLRPI